MVGILRDFSSYIPCSENVNVKIVDGSPSIVTGKGDIPISNSEVLKSALFVPNLSCNPVSISKLTQDMNCCAKFFPTHCEF